MGTQRRIENGSMTHNNCDAKDEMNLAEFPLCSLAHRLRPETKTLRFEDRIWDKSSGEWITRQLLVTGSDAYGLPTELDDEVLLGLIQLSRRRGFADRKVPFTRHELIRLLDWRDESKSYQRIEASLNRWTGVTLYYNKAWWNKTRGCWVDEKFHVLDNVWLCHRSEPPPDTGFGESGAPLSAFVWNDVLFRSFHAGNLKSIDFDFFLSLRSAVAKRLYRFLDKRFWHRDRWEMDLRELCCEHVGLSRNYDTANLKRKLLRGIQELNARGFLRSMETHQQFRKVRAGEWKVVFERQVLKKIPCVTQTVASPDPLAQELIDRGVAEQVALQAIEKYPKERIRRQLSSFDWAMKRTDVKPLRNPPGFLISSIHQDFAMPDGYNQRPEFATVVTAPPAPQVPHVPKRVIKTIQPVVNEVEVQRFHDSLSFEEHARFESKALLSATPVQRHFLEGGGTLASATRECLLNAAAIEALELAKRRTQPRDLGSVRRHPRT